MSDDTHQTSTSWWMRISLLSGVVGGVILVIGALAMLSVPNEAESDIVERIAAFGMIFLTLALPALYASERRWFGRFATAGFWTMAIGWAIAAVAALVTAYTMPPISETAFVVILVALLVALIGAFAFGVVVLRTDAATVPRLGAWLLLAAIPVGLPFTIGFTQFVMGELAEPWAGPLLLYAVAWIMFSLHMRSHQPEPNAPETVTQ